MSDPTILVPAIGWPLLIAYLLRLWHLERRARRTHAEADALWESDAWADLARAVEQARADIDAIPASVPALAYVQHPSGLALIARHHIDITDLQRAETPADLWRDA